MRLLLVLTFLVGVLLAPSGFDTVAARPRPAVSVNPDPDWVFYTHDKTWYTSPWFGGKHRIMIPFGCTRAPYYAPDPRCTTADGRHRGFHHGIDIAMACGTKLFAARP